MKFAGALLAGAAAIAIGGCRSEESSSPPTPPSASSASASADGRPHSSVTNTNTEANSRQLALYVEGLTCEGCAWQIRETLQKVDGIDDIRTTVADKRVVVAFDARRASPTAITRALEQVGYKSVELPSGSSSSNQQLDTAPSGTQCLGEQ